MINFDVNICYSMPEVRESAGLAFSTLYKSAGMQAIDEIVPTLLHALEDDETSDTALDGLKQILSVRTTAVLPHIFPKLVRLPLSAFNIHALGALAEVAGHGLNFHLGTILPALLSAMGAEDKDVQTLAKEAAETVALVIDEEGVEYLIAELLKGAGDTLASIRRSSSYLIGFFFKYSKLYMVDEAPNMISTLIILLSDSDSSTVEVAWEALSRVIGSVPKEALPSYIKLVRDAVSTSRDKEQGKRRLVITILQCRQLGMHYDTGGPVVIPGFCLPKALQPLLPIFLQGLTSGFAELREQAALGLGELIEVTSEKALKDFVIPITGPLIRIIGGRFPWQVKSAILSTLSILIGKGGMSLRPFLPQLQTTFIKCLQDSTRTVRTSAAFALGKLSALSTRVDPLVSDLLSSLQVWHQMLVFGEAILTALKGVLKHAGKSVSDPVRVRVFSQLKDLIHHDDDQVRISAASILGITSQYMEEHQLDDLLELLSNLASSPSWVSRHGSVLTISSLLRHNPSSVVTSQMFPSIIHCLKDALKDEKFPLRETSRKALGRLILHQIQSDPSEATAYVDIISTIMSVLHDDSSEVRRRGLSALKAVAKICPHVSLL
ncbi:hypothetical protein POTOM_058149 [Populus tomentosa]|uniref:Stalled ribosome sensor GCN1-like HEAT repeats region domain-containing protein n=1 Tax=Populus tomentosa TaxID=118781 RepID=A0A8X8C0G2_POPTO|nr:hypothetical protein POTOM_058149 [Populus tomentosa]